MSGLRVEIAMRSRAAGARAPSGRVVDRGVQLLVQLVELVDRVGEARAAERVVTERERAFLDAAQRAGGRDERALRLLLHDVHQRVEIGRAHV